MRLLRPYPALFRQGLIACIAFLTPVFVVLYWITVPSGPWRVVVGVQAVATAIVSLAAYAYFGTAIWVAPGEISERGFFGRRTRFERESIGSVILTHTYSGPDLTPIPQLFVCGHDGKQLVRMRGQFWSRESMDAVVSALGVPVTINDDPVSLADLRRDSPNLLYWFERRPVMLALVFSALIAAAGFIIVLVTQID